MGALLFAYAILRHRLGFAIDRTLVHSALSFLILVVFGCVEWTSAKLLPIESHAASALIKASVALTLFLVIHHVHAWIEGVVERLFFRRWHANEEALQRFLHQASYVTRADVLLVRAADELKRFSGGATVTVYRSTPDGYAMAAGDVGPEKLDADAPALVTLRADRTFVRDGFAIGDIVLPMTHRADVTGSIVLGPKPAGDPYRPDEEKLLAEAAGRIGLDLYALRMEELEASNARLSMQMQVSSVRDARRRPAAAAVRLPT